MAISYTPATHYEAPAPAPGREPVPTVYRWQPNALAAIAGDARQFPPLDEATYAQSGERVADATAAAALAGHGQHSLVARVALVLFYPFALLFVLLGCVPRLAAPAYLFVGWALSLGDIWVAVMTRSIGLGAAAGGAGVLVIGLLWLASEYRRYGDRARDHRRALGWADELEGEWPAP